MASFVKVTADNSQTDAKRKAREARFKNDSKKLAPPKPKRSFAHPGGKITHNKEAALAAYLKRKKGRLTEDQKAMLANLERLKKVNIEKKEETEVQAVEKKPTSVATGAEASPNEAWDVSIFKSSTTEDGMTRSTTVTDDVTKEWGYFGINIHRSNPHTESTIVEKWSAGCQVFKKIDDYNEFLEICGRARKEWGNAFTYTLLKEEDLKL